MKGQNIMPWGEVIPEGKSQSGWYFQTKAWFYALECALRNLECDACEKKNAMLGENSLEMHGI